MFADKVNVGGLAVHVVIPHHSYDIFQGQFPLVRVVFGQTEERLHQKVVHQTVRADRYAVEEELHDVSEVRLVPDKNSLCLRHQVSQESQLVGKNFIDGLIGKSVALQVRSSPVGKVFFQTDII